MYYFGQYIPGKSIIHRLDPRVKIAVLISLSLIIFRADVLILVLSSAFLLIVTLRSQISPRYILKALKPSRVFFIFIFLLYVFLTPGTSIPPFPWGKINITYDGLYQGILLIWKLILLVISASILTMVTSISELTLSMERFLRPLRIIGVSSHDLAVMLSIALRFIPTLLQETNRIKEAQMARGLDLMNGNITKKVKGAASLMIPVVLNAFSRADQLAVAMEARGYQTGPKTYLYELCMTWFDYIVLTVTIITLATLIMFY
ncbi:MAG: energy-coupling factor transporter transmembrane component T [Syntrophomonas sp.]